VSTDSKRIMMISTHGYVGPEVEFGKPDTGGQVVYVLELSRSLARLGYEVDILTRQFEDQPHEEPVSERCRVLRFPCGGKEFIPKETLWVHIPGWCQSVRRYVQEHGLDYSAIFTHYWDAGLAGLDLSADLKAVHVHVPHSIGSWKRDNMDGDPEELERLYNFRRRIREEKIIYDECDLLIATTPQQREILAGGEYDVPREKIHVIPPGYDDARFFPVSIATRRALKAERGVDGRLVLALGRMAHNKGYDLLIRSMPVVFDRLDDVRLMLAVGSSQPSEREKEQIQELKELAAELDIADRVLFHDYIEDNDLPDYYRMADVFALSSRYEPFGMTAIEAMACGTPTVVTTEGGLWERVVFGIEAVYANPFDPEAYGHAIYNVLKHPRVATNLAKFGSHRARASYTWMGIAHQIMRLTQTYHPGEKSPPIADLDDELSEGAAEPALIPIG
jgi:mannosylfructose-phosphate synthase